MSRVTTFLNIRVKRVYYRLFFRKQIKFGEKLTFRKRLNILVSDTAELTIGNNVFFNNDCSVNCLKRVTIGNDVLFGENVKIYDHNHNYKDKQKSIRSQGLTSKEINIGSNVWIGSNVTILSGVQIGDNCVIGAGVIVFKDIPKNSIIINKQEHIALNN